MTSRLSRLVEFVTRDPEISIIFSDNRNKGITIYDRDGITASLYLDLNYDPAIQKLSGTGERQWAVYGLNEEEKALIQSLITNGYDMNDIFPLKELQ